MYITCGITCDGIIIGRQVFGSGTVVVASVEWLLGVITQGLFVHHSFSVWQIGKCTLTPILNLTKYEDRYWIGLCIIGA